VVNLKVEDYYPSGKRFLLRFKEKGGKEKELPVHHKLEELRTSISNQSKRLRGFGTKAPPRYKNSSDFGSLTTLTPIGS
jgi:hypothetical protein